PELFLHSFPTRRSSDLFSRRRKTRPPPLPYCENCGAPMAGPFCAQCGQAAVDYRRSIRHIIADVLDSFLNWDSKFFATIGWLIEIGRATSELQSPDHLV